MTRALQTPLFLLLFLVVTQGLGAAVTITRPADSGFLARLAAKEMRRYLYLRTGQVPALTDQEEVSGTSVTLGVKGQILERLPEQARAAAGSLGPSEYLIHTSGKGSGRRVWIVGGDDLAVLYGAYNYSEALGIRFYLHGDVVPDGPPLTRLPEVNQAGKPLFDIRGIQPFHDFPEGPDWWNRDDYLAYVSQLPKLRMNFLGLHCYPEKGPHAEPSVWIGVPEDHDQQGVSFSYPAMWANTQRDGHWGYVPMRTSDFSAGAAQFFAEDSYGPDVMSGMMPEPGSAGQSNELFNRSGLLLKAVFSEARQLGIKTCVGTEIPLTVPALVKERLASKGKSSTDPHVVRDLYTGIFERIKATYPIDYYWFWTPEDWTWEGNKPEQFQATVLEIRSALSALDSLGNPFTLATSGWVLGPANDRAALDKVLPKNVPMSCINREVGHDLVEPGFAAVQGRPKWAIPWMENDPNLISPQPWVGRMRYDAVDARRLGCTGLLGIHWRTKILSANISALAEAGWDQSFAPVDWRVAGPPRPDDKPTAIERRRSMPVDDFYTDFARANFGESVAVPAGRILAAIDGLALPEASHWDSGPGAITAAKIDPATYAFVDQMEQLENRVTGAGNRARFAYWLNTYRYMRALARLGSTKAELDASVKELSTERRAGARKTMAAKSIKVRVRMAREWEHMMSCLLAATDTPGELGTIANLEQHNRSRLNFLTAHDKVLEAASRKKLPRAVEISKQYVGPPRVIVPTVRNQARAAEEVSVRVIAIDRKPVVEVRLHWRPLGQGEFRSEPARHLGRAVFQGSLPVGNEDLEYYVTAETASGQQLVWPETAPALSQTVVVLP